MPGFPYCAQNRTHYLSQDYVAQVPVFGSKGRHQKYFQDPLMHTPLNVASSYGNVSLWSYSVYYAVLRMYSPGPWFESQEANQR